MAGMAEKRASEARELEAFLEREVYADESVSLQAAFEISAADLKYVNQVAGGQKSANYGEVLPSSWIRVLDFVKPTRDDCLMPPSVRVGTYMCI